MIKIMIELPADAAKRLIDLLNSQTPEGEAARKALGVTSAKLHPAKGDIR
jgi:hypothetical protein